MGIEDLCRVPLAAAHHGRARQSSWTETCGYCRRVQCVPVSRGQYSGKICFIEKPGVQDDPPGSLPRSKSTGTGPSANCGYCYPLCPFGDQYSGKICFIEKPGVQDEGCRHVVLTPQVAYLEVKVQVRDLVRVVGIATPFAPRGSIFGENLFYRETRSTRRGWSPCG